MGELLETPLSNRPLHRRRHRLPSLHLLAGDAAGGWLHPTQRRRRQRHAQDRQQDILQEQRVRRLGDRRLSGQRAPPRPPPVLPRLLYIPHQGAELLLEGLRREGQRRAGGGPRQLRQPGRHLHLQELRQVGSRRRDRPRGDGEDRSDPQRGEGRHRRVRVQEDGRRGDGPSRLWEHLLPGERALEARQNRSGPLRRRIEKLPFDRQSPLDHPSAGYAGEDGVGLETAGA